MENLLGFATKKASLRKDLVKRKAVSGHPLGIPGNSHEWETPYLLPRKALLETSALSGPKEAALQRIWLW